MAEKRSDATARLTAVLDAPEDRTSLPQLLSAAGDPTPEVARAALKRLAKLGTPAEAPALRELLFAGDLSLTRDIARTLRALDDGATVDARLGAPEHPDYKHRIAALHMLELFADPSTADKVRAALRDPVGGVRAAALGALGRVGLELATARACAALLGDELPYVRIAAVHALASLPQAGELLRIATTDSDRQVRCELAGHSHMLGADAARALINDCDPHVREAAVRAAGIVELSDLRRSLTDGPRSDVRLAAAQVLGRLGDQRAVAALITALADPAALVVAASLHALEQLLPGRAG